jgi:hypothetical protein
MQCAVIPLLKIERDLHRLPRGSERFQAYVNTIQPDSATVMLPLVAMNPMGKEHVAALLDRLIALDAEAVAAAASAEASERLRHVPGSLQVGLVVSDDLMGGWTNRYFSEMSGRFDLQQAQKYGWAVVTLWSSEEPDVAVVRQAVLASIYRNAYFRQYGHATSLEQMLAQEGWAMRFAGMPMPALDPEELEYSREVIAPHRATTAYPTIVAALYGDEAAASVGYPPLGLSPRAGFAVALAQARASDRRPEELLGAGIQ